VAADVIRGDHPGAANLANVWLELRKTLDTLADADYRARYSKPVKVARRLPDNIGPEGRRAGPAPDEPEPGEGTGEG
jgi:hypothetical protein